ncbi:MAG: 5-formyltetrahydrofolate cyclo-ligase [Litoreibacter sp.]
MDMMQISKKNARKTAMVARREAKSQVRDLAAQAMLEAALLPFQGKVLAGYMPILTEVDPLPVMASMAARGRVCVPVIQGAGLPLRFRQWLPDAEMEDGPFGAQVPASGDWIEPEVLIVPLVGFDAQGGRIGYGGGFYDRTLEGLRTRKVVTAYGFAFQAQQVETLPQEPTDQKLDGIVTELGTTLFD